MFTRFNFHFWQTVWHLKSVFGSLILMIVAGAFLIAYAEHIAFQHAVYFAFVTGLTIGYGDIVPTTPIGQIVSILLGIIGILYTGLVVAVAVRALREAWADLHGTD
jgi:Na+-translocating ferredoxin:NAD+ oxidoreductase RnfE subunit